MKQSVGHVWQVLFRHDANQLFFSPARKHIGIERLSGVLPGADAAAVPKLKRLVAKDVISITVCYLVTQAKTCISEPYLRITPDRRDSLQCCCLCEMCQSQLTPSYI